MRRTSVWLHWLLLRPFSSRSPLDQLGLADTLYVRRMTHKRRIRVYHAARRSVTSSRTPAVRTMPPSLAGFSARSVSGAVIGARSYQATGMGTAWTATGEALTRQAVLAERRMGNHRVGRRARELVRRVG